MPTIMKSTNDINVRLVQIWMVKKSDIFVYILGFSLQLMSHEGSISWIILVILEIPWSKSLLENVFEWVQEMGNDPFTFLCFVKWRRNILPSNQCFNHCATLTKDLFWHISLSTHLQREHCCATPSEQCCQQGCSAMITMLLQHCSTINTVTTC